MCGQCAHLECDTPGMHASGQIWTKFEKVFWRGQFCPIILIFTNFTNKSIIFPKIWPLTEQNTPFQANIPQIYATFVTFVTFVTVFTRMCGHRPRFYWPDLLSKVGKAWASGQISGQFCGHYCPTWGEFCPHNFFRSGHLSTKNEDTCRNPDLSDLGQCPQTQSKEKASVEAVP